MVALPAALVLHHVLLWLWCPAQIGVLVFVLWQVLVTAIWLILAWSFGEAADLIRRFEGERRRLLSAQVSSTDMQRRLAAMRSQNVEPGREAKRPRISARA